MFHEMFFLQNIDLNNSEGRASNKLTLVYLRHGPVPFCYMKDMSAWIHTKAMMKAMTEISYVTNTDLSGKNRPNSKKPI